jgi:hypothetical protein
MSKTLSVCFSNYVFEQHFQNLPFKNRSKYIEEMFLKGINSEMSEFQGFQAQIIAAQKKTREQQEIISNLSKELALVKSRVITQEVREAERKIIRDKKEAEKKIKDDKKRAEEEQEEKFRKMKLMDRAIKASGFLEHIGEGERNDKK